MSKLRILAVGATGSVGRHVVDEALRCGHQVRALVRNLTRRALPAAAEVVIGDLTRVDTLVSAVEGIDAIIFTHGTYGSASAGETVDYGGVRNVLTALGDRKPRIALMTTIGATDRKGAHDSKRRAERLVRASGLIYTIVRPGWFDHNRPGEDRLVLRQGDKHHSGTPDDGVIARRQLARVLVRSLTTNSASRKTFELVAAAGPETTDFDRLFATVDEDAPNALDGLHDEPNMPLEAEPRQVLDALEAIRPRH